MVGFAAAIVVGIASNIEATAVLTRATAIMILCFVIGSIVGKVAQRTIDLHIQRHQELNPIPERDTPITPGHAQQDGDTPITSSAAQARTRADAA